MQLKLLILQGISQTIMGQQCTEHCCVKSFEKLSVQYEKKGDNFTKIALYK